MNLCGLLALLVMLLASCLGISVPGADVPISPDDAPGAPGVGMFRNPLAIESVDVMVLESDPVQVSLTVTGYHDGCEYPVTIEQRRAGNEVFVDIYREMPVDVICPMIAVSYIASISLEGSFESGTYTIHVNDFVQTLDL